MYHYNFTTTEYALEMYLNKANNQVVINNPWNDQRIFLNVKIWFTFMIRFSWHLSGRIHSNLSSVPHQSLRRIQYNMYVVIMHNAIPLWLIIIWSRSSKSSPGKFVVLGCWLLANNIMIMFAEILTNLTVLFEVLEVRVMACHIEKCVHSNSNQQAYYYSCFSNVSAS